MVHDVAGRGEVADAAGLMNAFTRRSVIVPRHSHRLIATASTDVTRDGVTASAVAMAVLAVLSIIVALATGRPEAIAFSLPFLTSLLLGALQYQPDTFWVSVDAEQGRYVEGDEATFIVSVSSESGVGRCTVELEPGKKMTMLSAPRVAVDIAPGETVQVPFVMRINDWGLVKPSRVKVRAEDGLAITGRSYEFSVQENVRVSLHGERLQDMIEPGRYRTTVGSHPSEQRGQGMELADVREYRPGDPLKSINWRISNRRNEPWVTVRHPDRSATVVIIADVFTTFAASLNPGVVRAVEALAKVHLGAHDRVGVLLAGVETAWLPPQLGQRQQHRIADALIDSTRRRKEWQKSPNLHRLIDTDAVIIVVSTLRDRRIMQSIATLRASGRRLIILEPVTSREEGATTVRGSKEDSAVRLDRLERELNRRILRQDGLTVVPWETALPIEPAIRNMRIVWRAKGGGI